jgi:hypothetical protein
VAALTRHRLVALACAAAVWVGCRERRPETRSSVAEPERASAPLRGPPSNATGSSPTLVEGVPRRDPLERLAPPDQPSQRIAISGDRLAWLDGERLRVLSMPELSELTSFLSTDARNVVALTGGGFLIAARDHVQRLSPRDDHPALFPHAPRIGPTTIIASRHESTQFWLHYAGVSFVPRFDLGAPARIASLPMLDMTELIDFDRRALLGLGDGSFVYTAPDGLRRIDVEGRPEHLPSAELAGRVWALARDARLDRVWAATGSHLYLVHVRERAESSRRFELDGHPVAIGSDDGAVAVLFVERWLERDLRLRVEVVLPEALTPVVFRLDARAPERGDASPAPALEPELALSRARGLAAVGAFGLQVYDFRRNVRLYPADLAQKLAPGAR